MLCIEPCSYDVSLFATNSLDNTVRLWDSRIFSSIKLFKDKSFDDKQMGALIFSKDELICTASE